MPDLPSSVNNKLIDVELATIEDKVYTVVRGPSPPFVIWNLYIMLFGLTTDVHMYSHYVYPSSATPWLPP